MDVENSSKKYSKISSALKYYFLECLYLKKLTIKETAARLHMNYSTAKVVIRDLSPKQRILVRKLIRRREEEVKKVKTEKAQTCSFRIIDNSEKVVVKEEHDSQNTGENSSHRLIQVISTVSYDFFEQ